MGARLILLTTPSSSVKQQHALTSQLMECVTMQMTNAVEDKLARLILQTTPSSSVKHQQHALTSQLMECVYGTNHTTNSQGWFPLSHANEEVPAGPANEETPS